MRTMYDSVNPRAIPRNAQMVLGYVDGIYAWSAEEWAMFPNSVHVTCSAIGTEQAHVYDVEPGCIWPIERVGPLVKRDWDQGLLPTVYLNRRNHWQAARDYFRRTYNREPQWLVAEYDGDTSIPDGAIGKQYAHPADPIGSAPSGPWELSFHADASSVRDFWPGIDTHAPGGGEIEETEMGFSHQQVNLPATETISDVAEHDVVFPDMGGSLGVTQRWVNIHSPGQPFIDPENPENGRLDANVALAHFVDGDGDIVGEYVPANTTLTHHTNGGSAPVPNEATKLVVQYGSVVGLLVGVSVKTS